MLGSWDEKRRSHWTALIHNSISNLSSGRFSPQRRSVVVYPPCEVAAVLPAGGDGVVEVGVGLLPRLVDAPGRVRLAEEEALRPDPPVRPDASAPVRHFRGVCRFCAICLGLLFAPECGTSC